MADRVDRTADVPTLSTEERDRRWADIRERMIQRNLDALVLWSNDRFWGMGRANLRYLTQVPGTQGNAIGIFPLHGDPVVFADFHMLHNPYPVYDVYQNWTDDVRTFQGLGPVFDEIKSRGLDDGRLGLVSYKTMLSEANLPHTHYEAFKKRLPDATFERATDLVNRARQIKSDEEIEMLRRAGDIASAMIEAFMNAEPGMTEAEVHADMTRAQIAAGGEPYIFNFFDSGDPTDPRRLHLLHGQAQPLSPTQRTLKDGDLVKTEIHANYGGYLAASDKSIVLGDAPPEVERINDMCIECAENAYPKFRPGTRLEDLWEAFRQPARDADMDFVSLGFHGHGLSSPEFPTVTFPQEPTRLYPDGHAGHLASGTSQEDVRLREGMVFGTSVDVYDPNWRDDVGLMYGETVLVTKNGPEILAHTPRDLVV